MPSSRDSRRRDWDPTLPKSPCAQKVGMPNAHPPSVDHVLPTEHDDLRVQYTERLNYCEAVVGIRGVEIRGDSRLLSKILMSMSGGWKKRSGMLAYSQIGSEFFTHWWCCTQTVERSALE